MIAATIKQRNKNMLPMGFYDEQDTPFNPLEMEAV